MHPAISYHYLGFNPNGKHQIRSAMTPRQSLTQPMFFIPTVTEKPQRTTVTSMIICMLILETALHGQQLQVWLLSMRRSLVTQQTAESDNSPSCYWTCEVSAKSERGQLYVSMYEDLLERTHISIACSHVAGTDNNLLAGFISPKSYHYFWPHPYPGCPLYNCSI